MVRLATSHDEAGSGPVAGAEAPRGGGHDHPAEASNGPPIVPPDALAGTAAALVALEEHQGNGEEAGDRAAGRRARITGR